MNRRTLGIHPQTNSQKLELITLAVLLLSIEPGVKELKRKGVINSNC